MLMYLSVVVVAAANADDNDNDNDDDLLLVHSEMSRLKVAMKAEQIIFCSRLQKGGLSVWQDKTIFDSSFLHFVLQKWP